MIDRRFSVAPMMDWTDRHCRFFHRLLSRKALLYTEMLTARAVLRGDRDHLLAMNESEHPVALQLGGCDPDELARAAEYGQRAGYDEINLNVGCPSDRVQEGRFGACLFLEPETVAASVRAMGRAVDIPVTVKTRIGVDDGPVGEPLREFVDRVSDAGCGVFIIHARKAWLSGLSPRQNREVPPLCYDAVYEIKQRFPALEVIVNGGIQDMDSVARHLRVVDGVMMGRAAYHDPWSLARVDTEVFGQAPPDRNREDIVREFAVYAGAQCARGVPLHAMSRHILGLYQGIPGARVWRRWLSEQAHLPEADETLLLRGVERVHEVAAEAA